MSDTPLTDAQVAIENPIGVPGNTAMISTEFTRQLERKLRTLAIRQMIYCYDEANRLANHGHGGHDRMAPRTSTTSPTRRERNSAWRMSRGRNGYENNLP